MAGSVLGNAIEFLNHLGVYDVVLPFLFVFTIVFAILEKTKIFGVEKVDGQTITRKNINAMAAFVMGFFVVASSQLVSLINTVASQAFLLILLLVLFLMLVGVMQKEGEFEMSEGWRKGLVVALFIALLLIFFNALGWLEIAYDFMSQSWDSEAVTAIILIVLIGIFIFWITKSKKPETTKKKD